MEKRRICHPIRGEACGAEGSEKGNGLNSELLDVFSVDSEVLYNWQ